MPQFAFCNNFKSSFKYNYNNQSLSCNSIAAAYAAMPEFFENL
jgi:hypothetical protein